MPAPLPAPGTLLGGRYRLDRILGEGGMGRVFLAEQLGTARPCAVKIMRAAVAHDPEAFARFQREAANAARIRHANVATVYDFGTTEEGVSYLAMEFVTGDSLAAVIRREGALPMARAAAIVRQVAEGLTAAHVLGIVHRDLKPDNILLDRDLDGSDLVKIADFGIAKTVNGSQTVTSLGAVIGTPEYMSPEQLAGESLDLRSDVYSLGVVAFQLLTGTLPHPPVTSRETLVKRLTHPSRKLADVRPDVAWPMGLQRVFDVALTPDAALRYPTVRDFARNLCSAIASAAGAGDPPALDGIAVTARDLPTATGPTAATVVRPLETVVPAAAPTVAAPRRSARRVLLAAGAVAALLVIPAAIVTVSALDDAPVDRLPDSALVRASRSTASLQGATRTRRTAPASRTTEIPRAERDPVQVERPSERDTDRPTAERAERDILDELQDVTDAARRHDYGGVADGLRRAAEDVREMRRRYPASPRLRDAERAVWLTGLSALKRCRSASSGGVVDAAACQRIVQLVPRDADR